MGPWESRVRRAAVQEPGTPPSPGVPCPSTAPAPSAGLEPPKLGGRRAHQHPNWLLAPCVPAPPEETAPPSPSRAAPGTVQRRCDNSCLSAHVVSGLTSSISKSKVIPGSPGRLPGSCFAVGCSLGSSYLHPPPAMLLLSEVTSHLLTPKLLAASCRLLCKRGN